MQKEDEAWEAALTVLGPASADQSWFEPEDRDAYPHVAIKRHPTENKYRIRIWFEKD